MKATIIILYQKTKKVQSTNHYNTEEAAQDVFDANTATWHEWDDPNRQHENPYRYAMDLIANPPKGRPIIRRSMYTNN